MPNTLTGSNSKRYRCGFLALISLCVASNFAALPSHSQTENLDPVTSCDVVAVTKVLFGAATQGLSINSAEFSECGYSTIKDFLVNDIKSLVKDIEDSDLSNEHDNSDYSQSIMAAYILGELAQCELGDKSSQDTLCEFWHIQLSQFEVSETEMVETLESTLRVLESTLKNQQPDLRALQEVSLEALGKFDRDAVAFILPTLIEVLGRQESSVAIRDNATSVILKIAPQYFTSPIPDREDSTLSVLEELSLFLEKEDSDLKVRTAQILGYLKEDATSSVPALIEALKSDDLTVHTAAAQALQQIGISNVNDVKSLIRLFLTQDLPSDIKEDIKQSSFQLLINLHGPSDQNITLFEEEDFAEIIRDLINSKSNQPTSTELALWISAENNGLGIGSQEFTTQTLLSILNEEEHIDNSNSIVLSALLSILNEEEHIDNSNSTVLSALYFIWKIGNINREILQIEEHFLAVMEHIILGSQNDNESQDKEEQEYQDLAFNLAVDIVSLASRSEDNTFKDKALSILESIFETNFKADSCSNEKSCKRLISASRALGQFSNIDEKFVLLLFDILESTPNESLSEECLLELKIEAVSSIRKIITQSNTSTMLESEPIQSSIKNNKDIFVSNLLSFKHQVESLERDDTAYYSVGEIRLFLFAVKNLSDAYKRFYVNINQDYERDIIQWTETRFLLTDDDRIPGTGATEDIFPSGKERPSWPCILFRRC